MGTHYDHLCAEERGTIMAMTHAGQGVREIARILNRAPSSISRERRRNGWRSDAERGAMGRPTIAGGYDAKRAGQRARRLCRRARRARKLALGSAFWVQVRSQLELGWSPEHIAGTLKKDRFGSAHLQVSHETIYTAIYAHPKGELRRELTVWLRQSRGGARRPRTGRVRNFV